MSKVPDGTLTYDMLLEASLRMQYPYYHELIDALESVPNKTLKLFKLTQFLEGTVDKDLRKSAKKLIEDMTNGCIQTESNVKSAVR